MKVGAVAVVHESVVRLPVQAEDRARLTSKRTFVLKIDGVPENDAMIDSAAGQQRSFGIPLQDVHVFAMVLQLEEVAALPIPQLHVTRLRSCGQHLAVAGPSHFVDVVL